LFTWVYLRTRSVLVTGLMHAAFNATVPLTWGLDAAWVWQARAIVLLLITAVVVGTVGLPWWRSPLRGSSTSESGQGDVRLRRHEQRRRPAVLPTQRAGDRLTLLASLPGGTKTALRDTVIRAAVPPCGPDA
jgi:hypothetical protein